MQVVHYTGNKPIVSIRHWPSISALRGKRMKKGDEGWEQNLTGSKEDWKTLVLFGERQELGTRKADKWRSHSSIHEVYHRNWFYNQVAFVHMAMCIWCHTIQSFWSCWVYVLIQVAWRAWIQITWKKDWTHRIWGHTKEKAANCHREFKHSRSL